MKIPRKTGENYKQNCNTKRFRTTFYEKFSPAFFKRRRSGGRGALLARRNGRNKPSALFFLPSFFFCAFFGKRKSGIEILKYTY